MTLLPENEIDQRLTGNWRREGDELVLDLEFADFAQSIAFVNRVAEIAETQGHHPDILVHGWNHVQLRLSTHSKGGITDADLDLAERIDALL